MTTAPWALECLRLPVTEGAANRATEEMARRWAEETEPGNTAICLGEAGAAPWLVVSGRWTIVGIQTGTEGCFITLQRVL